MAKPLDILCVHGVGNHHTDLTWQRLWTDAIRRAVGVWAPDRPVQTHFVMYDDLFEQAPLTVGGTLGAMGTLLASGIAHGIGDLLRRRRGLLDLDEKLRWTAGMVVQWAENEQLRQRTRQRLLEHLTRVKPDVLCSHSLGSLISYDTLIHPGGAEAIAGRYFLSLGSQIGNPFVRRTFAGRLVPVNARRWFHLYNRLDDVLTAEVRLPGVPNYEQVHTEFDLPGFGDHDASSYLSHANTVQRVWGRIAGGGRYRALAASQRPIARLAKRPNRRALLVGIDDYPNPSDRLAGCVNDVFQVSSVLQELGFGAENIRVVLNHRATADGIRQRLNWLLEDVSESDQRVFYYSGHGAQVPGYGIGETVDHLDECLVPHDFDWSAGRAILDDDLYDLYSQLPYGARFLMILDCCHSGGMARDGGLKVRGLNPPDDVRHRAMRWDAGEQMWVQRELVPPNRSMAKLANAQDYLGRSGAMRRLGRSIDLRTLPNRQYDRVRRDLDHHGPYLPMIYQACREDQYAYEYRHGVTSHGAFTYCMSQALRDHHRRGRTITFDGLLKTVGKKLRQLRYDQTPALLGPRSLRQKPIPW